MARRESAERRREARQTVEETEGAAGGPIETVTRPEDWGELSALEERGKREKKMIRPDGAEVVTPYRWPAEQGPEESTEAYESRLAEYELEMFLNSKQPLTTVALERARAQQRKALKARRERQWTVDDVESQPPMPRAARSKSPQPGPPTEPRRELGARPKEKVGPQVRTMEEGQNTEQRERRGGGPQLKQKARGIVFGGLNLIPTERSLDPPPYSCFNCWRGGHNAEECRQPKRHQYCWNCGRRFTSVERCPRCARAYARYMGRAYDAEPQPEERPVREGGEERGREEERVYAEPPRPSSGQMVEPEVQEPEAAAAGEEEGGKQEDLAQSILTLTKALAGLPAETLDLAIRQLLREREVNMEKGVQK